MPFERLLFTSCLLPGQTHFKEDKASVGIDPERGETILFFCIDDNSTGNPGGLGCKLRKELWGDKPGERICDLLVFYAKEDRRVLCFVELKSCKSDFGDATEQVINTCRAIKTELRLSNQYSLQAFLVGNRGSAPQEQRKHQDRLKKEFGEKFRYNGSAGEFAAFLRGTEKQELSRKRSK